ncbi:DUF2971 domain-containing protein [Clostridium estertheticum]|uniref:DUF2971 domain-containing protein n=1 Tax=Clostridium estertheticum TaxID=238834 RepID=UPI001C7D559B|nr:DUF2971 domain-containing protein [Clostridium estertheticum]MBX4272097.1 DUF2971 domain-containing protein [Clostridium estertheticum]WLC78900.1 DUF2971 domain-containing protein [Clostridium estertheticum]
MGNFNFSSWQERIANRTDMTGMLTHLTKPTEIDLKSIDIKDEREINLRSIDNVIKILIDKKIEGSTTEKGFIVGKSAAVCFQDVPMYSLVQNVKFEQLKRGEKVLNKIRYCGVGLSFGKFYVFTKGGRPVFYEQTEKAKGILPKEEHWRIVNIQLIPDNPIIDWTHEREWRFPKDFTFETNMTNVILYDSYCWKYFMDKCPQEIIKDIYGITILKSVLM